MHCVPDTPEVVTADVNGYFKLWDLRNFQCVQTPPPAKSDDGRGGLSGMSHFIHCGPKRNRFVASTKCIHFIDQGNCVREPVSHDFDGISCVCYNNTNLSILSTTAGTVKIWDAITGNIRNIYRDLMTSDITAVCLDDRERKFIAGDANGHIRVFNYANGALMKQLHSHKNEVSQLVYCGEKARRCRCCEYTARRRFVLEIFGRCAPVLSGDVLGCVASIPSGRCIVRNKNLTSRLGTACRR